MAFEGLELAPRDIPAKLHQHGEELAALAWENEKLGKLSDRTAQILRETGMMRLTQPKKFGGMEAKPSEFLEAVMTAARYDGSAGWVSGVVGIHPWQVPLLGDKLGAEIWGENQDTWIASPYTPSAIAEPVEGGYRVSGRWQFSSGTDHAQWVFLGALIGNGKGAPAMPPRMLHVILPRRDYQILDDTWDVIGLLGTGSKDVVAQDVFVPNDHVLEYDRLVTGEAGAKAAEEQGNLVYNLPFSVIFPVGITGAIVGMAEGALAAHAAYQKNRVNAAGARVADDPYSAFAAGEAAAEIHAARVQLFDGINWAYDQVMEGKLLTLEDRSRIRRNQVRCAWRAVAAIDTIYARSGGNASRRTNPIQRFWRDAHVGLNHFIHVPGTTYHANAVLQYGMELPMQLQIGL